MPLTRLLLLLLLLPATLSAKPSGVPLKPVSLQLKWYHQFQFAGYYAALERGYYSDAGLEVTIREGNPEHNPIEDVVNGRADFGIGASELLLARANDKPVVALATIFQHSPLVLLALQGPEITTVHDLVGKKIEIVPHEYELFAFMQAMGLKREDFTLLPRASEPDALVEGKVAAISAYSTDEPFLLEQQGLSYLTISPRSAGIDFYGDSLFTSEKMIRQSPETVAAFREASLKGWQYALEHPEPVARLILEKYNKEKRMSHLLYEARAMRNLIMPNLVELGYMNPGRWEHIARSYESLGLMEQEVDLEQFLYTSEVKQDLSWFYWTIGAILLLTLAVTLVAVYIFHLNSRLRFSETRYRILYESAPMAILAWDERRRITAWNRMAEQMFGWSAEEVLGRDFFDFMIPVEEAEHMEALLGTIHHGHTSMGSLNWNLTKGGGKILCEWMNAVLEDHSGTVTEVVALAVDVTEKRRIQQSLEESERRYRLLAENAIDVIWTMNLEGRFTYVSPSIERLRGYSVEEVLNHSLEEALAPGSLEAVHEALQHLLMTGEVLQHNWEVEQLCKDGTTVWTDVIVSVVRDAGGVPLEIVGITRDATNRRRLEHKLQNMAHFDSLTGLPNRTLFFDRLDQGITLARRNREKLGLLFIDLDGFKNANDNYGHEYGDHLLQEVARRLREQVRDSDTVARMGGDEFTILLHNIGSREDCERIARQLIETIDTPYLVDGHYSQLTASIGISLFPDDSQSGEELLNMADKAMYTVKHSGKHDYRFFTN